jgi:insulysin
LNAVDSEHKKNHQSDLWRIFQVSKHLSKDGHPWKKFGSGNRESLSKAAKELKSRKRLENGNGHVPTPNNLSLSPSPIPSRIASPAPSVSSTSSENEADGGEIGRETRRRLIEWWKQEYCASRMHLCVLGKGMSYLISHECDLTFNCLESLDELADLVSTLFSPIPNRQVDPLPMFYDHPFGPNEKGTLISVQTIMSMHVLEISIPLEYQGFNWRHKPANFLAHFIGHEGPGSLYSYLKQKHWVSGLRAGPQAAVRGFEFFHLTIYLTNEGFSVYFIRFPDAYTANA